MVVEEKSLPPRCSVEIRLGSNLQLDAHRSLSLAEPVRRSGDRASGLGTRKKLGVPVAQLGDILVNLWSTSSLAPPAVRWRETTETRRSLRPLARTRVLRRHGKEGVNGSSPLEGFTKGRQMVFFVAATPRARRSFSPRTCPQDLSPASSRPPISWLEQTRSEAQSTSMVRRVPRALHPMARHLGGGTHQF
jgi:hypothetical protein